ncbi:MAG: cytochrome c biogenesis protein ResB [Bacteriovoracaceae bacterium]|nr:cytochrome c biogenesis protein ResB [Bacteriovoracaceae bacterium]
MWNSFLRLYQQTEKTLGSLKFAVFIILIFAVCLIFGTFMESYHGAEYANRLVYKSLPFMGVQLLMFLSILSATLLRLPPKKHLYGFYVIHLGLMTLFLGSYITYEAGVDGSLTLAPNSPAREVSLNTDQLLMQFPAKGNQVTIDLPYSFGTKNLDFKWENIKILRFIPFADEVIGWSEDKLADTSRLHSGEYRIENDNFGEDFTLSLHPASDFESTAQLGPLSVHYMPEVLADCFGKDSHKGLLVWDAQGGRCFAPQTKDMKEQKGISGKNLLILKESGEDLRFLPDLSPLPVDKDLKIVQDSPYRIFSRSLFQEKPHLFLFGRFVGYFDKEASKWMVKEFKNLTPVDLPWMGFKIVLKNHSPSKFPIRVPEAVTPIQDNGQLIKGAMKAIEIQAGDTRFWVTNQRAMSIEDPKDGKIIFQLGRKSLTLPFEITLDQFKMDTDPGTNNPASYESFVTLFKGNEGSEKHHVFMNHPMKYSTFTFYQASYFQTQQGPFGSIFSVNYDPGRPWKYLGSILLVLGSLWHFVLRKKPSKKNAETSHA